MCKIINCPTKLIIKHNDISPEAASFPFVLLKILKKVSPDFTRLFMFRRSQTTKNHTRTFAIPCYCYASLCCFVIIKFHISRRVSCIRNPNYYYILSFIHCFLLYCSIFVQLKRVLYQCGSSSSSPPLYVVLKFIIIISIAHTPVTT